MDKNLPRNSWKFLGGLASFALCVKPLYILYIFMLFAKPFPCALFSLLLVHVSAVSTVGLIATRLAQVVAFQKVCIAL